MRILTTICAAAIVVAFCAPAFAETQNVKVSGDITVYHLLRNQLDLNEDDGDGSDRDTHFIQQAGLNVNADLTDNVSTYIRIINERDWDTSNRDNGRDFQISLDEAYLTLKEFLYAPLAVKIGRQNLWFGRGFIVGSNSDPLALDWDYENTIGADELSDQTAFDAIRGTLDYDPWTIDLVWAKIDENNLADYDDIDLYGINVGYIFDRYEAEAEAYYWNEHVDVDPNTTDSTRTHTVGVRGSMVPVADLNAWGELGYQFGRYDTPGRRNTDIGAWAGNAGADYTFADKWMTPMIGAEYVYYSGEDFGNGGDWGAWNGMYRGAFYTQIREFQNVLYNTDYLVDGGADRNLKNTRGQNAGNVNQNQIGLFGSLNPMEDVKLSGRWSYFWLDESLSSANTSDEIGHELDGKITYDYTEDVAFSLAGGIFWAGDVYPNEQDDTASQVISAVKVEF